MIKKIVSKILRANAHRFPKQCIKLHYLICFKKGIDFNNIKTLNEKIQWLKLHELHKDIYTQCADKYKVREYVRSKGCGEILNELYGTYESVNEIDYDKLPERFALKCNHGAGYNIICDDKNKLDRDNTNHLLSKWMKQDFSSLSVEPQYKNIERKIICEKYIENKNGGYPDDYKFYCFNGEPHAVMVCQGRENGIPKFYYFDMGWNLLPYSIDSLDAINNNYHIEKPDGFDAMKSYAKQLSTDFKFVRADFYLLNAKVLFGELTFTPSAGLDVDRLEQTDIGLGDKLDI
ncbi:ATP-grasp fold amidoligase family protein [Kluyvera sp. STS39-E]|uniref:ATP-grasp fold amidoligase family protein n=1 Tax=Kluyvera sp. STS39-E TaxID=3234748 RepID=UPI0034C680C4